MVFFVHKQTQSKSLDLQVIQDTSLGSCKPALVENRGNAEGARQIPHKAVDTKRLSTTCPTLDGHVNNIYDEVRHQRSMDVTCELLNEEELLKTSEVAHCTSRKSLVKE